MTFPRNKGNVRSLNNLILLNFHLFTIQKMISHLKVLNIECFVVTNLSNKVNLITIRFICELVNECGL